MILFKKPWTLYIKGTYIQRRRLFSFTSLDQVQRNKYRLYQQNLNDCIVFTEQRPILTCSVLHFNIKYESKARKWFWSYIMSILRDSHIGHLLRQFSNWFTERWIRFWRCLTGTALLALTIGFMSFSFKK